MQHQNQPSENEYETFPEEESESPSNSMVCFFHHSLRDLYIITPALIYVAYCIANSSLLVLTKSNYEQSTATKDKMSYFIITIIISF